MRSRTTRWSVAGLALVALTLGACTNQDVDRDDVLKTLKSAGATTEQRTCVADRLDDELDKDQMNEVGKADDLADLDKPLRDIVDATLNECVGGGAPADETETTDTTEGESEATTTTVG